jgi:hypothetical protein
MNKIYKIMLVMVVLMLVFAACAPASTNKKPKTSSSLVVATEQAKQANNQSKFLNDTPNMGNDKTTLERTNLNKRMTIWNDPNKIGYLYEISDNGIILAFYTIKGKVSSLNSYLSGSETIVKDPNCKEWTSEGANCQSLLMESPDYDGSYGDNGGGIFFFLTDGTYMEWNGKYQLSDQPVKLSQQPIMTYDVTE